MPRISALNKIIVLFYIGLLLFIIWKVPHEKDKSLERSEQVTTIEKGDSF